ncbi:lengsin [Sminthopsis crassicaudata]|uniref:lengsin n=1 Tax=Sminthopsis crassicaudata TaxID=9301 RepID=UPI003D690FA5
MDTSFSQDILDYYDLPITGGHLQTQVSPPLQKTACISPEQQEPEEERNKNYSHVASLKNGKSRLIKEIHENNQLKQMETSLKGDKEGVAMREDKPVGGKADNENASQRMETEITTEHLGNHDKGVKQAFALYLGMPRSSRQELDTLLPECSLAINLNRHGSKPRDTLSSRVFLSKPCKQTMAKSKQWQTFQTFYPHHGEDPKPNQDIIGMPSKTILRPIFVESEEQQTGGPEEQPTGIKTTPSRTTGSKSNLEFDSNTRHIGGSKDHDTNNPRFHIPLPLFSRVEHIKQEMTRDNIHFVRFEATDLHGVSRSKSIPARFFPEKAIHGISIPRGYLELTLNPKDSEVDHLSVTSFNSDIILIPELSTFRPLPWAERTARVICDPFTIMGNPLSTSPRHIAKRQLSHLRDRGFSLLSAFTYEFCIYGVAEVIDSKTISFPMGMLLSSHDQLFIQELVDGMYHMGVNIESFSSSIGPGQMEVAFWPEFGITSADNAFTFRTGSKEVAKKHNYLASFFTETGFYNSGILAHSLWDTSGRKNLFSTGSRVQQLTDIGKKWLTGLLKHSAALSCLMAPAVSCRKRYSVDFKEPKECVAPTWGYNDNSCSYNIKCHGEKGTQIENKLGSATANPYLVLAATIAAGLDGIQSENNFLDSSGDSENLAQTKPSEIPLKLEDALVALGEDKCLREALGDTFIHYFVAMKQYELENEETESERNKFLEYFI